MHNSLIRDRVYSGFPEEKIINKTLIRVYSWLRTNSRSETITIER